MVGGTERRSAIKKGSPPINAGLAKKRKWNLSINCEWENVRISKKLKRLLLKRTNASNKGTLTTMCRLSS